MSAYDFCQYFFSYTTAIKTIKDIKVYFSNESHNEEQIQNNEYIITSGLTRGVTDVSGICPFKQQWIKI